MLVYYFQWYSEIESDRSDSSSSSPFSVRTLFISIFLSGGPRLSTFYKRDSFWSCNESSDSSGVCFFGWGIVPPFLPELKNERLKTLSGEKFIVALKSLLYGLA